jgi:hypothetical protein
LNDDRAAHQDRQVSCLRGTAKAGPLRREGASEEL